jgi:TetR/AcrR family tetracycline transcriptional repressor
MLTPEAVVEAAARVLARDGYAGLTMRAIADDLGVQAPALYWYFGDKQALERALYEHLMADFAIQFSGDHWRDYLRQAAQQLRVHLRGVRDVIRLAPQGFWLGPNSAPQLETTLRILRGAGLSAHDAAYACNMLYSFVTQWAAAEADFSGEQAEFLSAADSTPPDPARYPNLAEAREFFLRWDPDGHFAFRLGAMIAGLEARIGSDSV